MSEKSRARFRRSSNPPKMTIGDLDLRILDLVHQYRLLSSGHLASLICERGHQSVLRRLHLLFQNGFLDRPPAQKRYYQHTSNRPLIYAVSTKGASSLKKVGRVDIDPGHWTQKNGQLKDLFLEHRMGVTDFLVRLHVESSTLCRVLNARELQREASHRSTGPVRFRWRVDLGPEHGFKKVGVIPDAVFAVEDQRTWARAYYFLEYDRGTMPLRRRSLDQTSFHRKLIAYYASWQQQIPQKEFGWPRFRVVTVTSSARRCEGLVSMARSLNRGRGTGLFLFTTVKALTAADSVLSLPLQAGRDEPDTTLSLVQ